LFSQFESFGFIAPETTCAKTFVEKESSNKKAKARDIDFRRVAGGK
jgi:hypothetical protein